MAIRKLASLLAGGLLVTVSAHAAAEPERGHGGPAQPAAYVAGAPAPADAPKVVNFRALAAKFTTLSLQGVQPLTNYSPMKAPAHRLPNGKTTMAANLSGARGPVFSRGALQPVPVEGAALQPKTPVAPPPVRGFVGLTTADTRAGLGGEFEPPDQGLAVNNGKVLEATNLMIQLYDAASGNPDLQFDNGHYATALPLAAFLDDPGVFSDPQVFFDPTLASPADVTAGSRGRWIVSVMANGDSWTWDPVAGKWVATNPDNFYIDVAVSQTSDATGGWNVYRFRTFSSDLSSIFGSCAGADCLPDYPKMGFDANGFYISVNLFNWATDQSFVGAATYALPKAKMRDGLLANYLRLFYVDPQNSATSFLVQPSMPAPGQASASVRGGTEYLLEARKLVDNVNHIRVWAIEGTSSLVADAPCNPGPGICAMRAFYVDVATPATPGTIAVPTPGYYYGGAYLAQQPNQPGPWSAQKLGFAADLDPGYGGFSATVQYAAGKLYGVLTTANPAWTVGNLGAGNLLSWYSITPAVNSTTGALSAALSAKGTVVPPAGYFLQYPALGVTNKGIGVIGLSMTNPTLNVPGNFPSSGYIKFTGKGTSGSITVTGQGQYADDGFSQWSTNSPGRWGDYGAAVVDPASPTTFYTANEMIAAPYTTMLTAGGHPYYANWSTFISVIH